MGCANGCQSEKQKNVQNYGRTDEGQSNLEETNGRGSSGEPIRNIMRENCKDWCISPDCLAQMIGFVSFDRLFDSSAMSDYIEQDLNDKNEKVFHMKNLKSIEHIQQFVVELEPIKRATSDKSIRERGMRMSEPENRAAYIEGKRRLIELMKEFHGTTVEVPYDKLQLRYKERFGVELSRKELTRLFGNKKILEVIALEFHGEISIIQVYPLTLMLSSAHVEDIVDDNPPVNTIDNASGTKNLTLFSSKESVQRDGQQIISELTNNGSKLGKYGSDTTLQSAVETEASTLTAQSNRCVQPSLRLFIHGDRVLCQSTHPVRVQVYYCHCCAHCQCSDFDNSKM
ncbi:unnamed protein product [Anisakis simplex]|uniref:HTH OST-type domain-containing protein n=1 Tax=Anisakis simplex TaxID=6269 RepID=A0A0M3K702_ANISI|nr:unnamed protein product [Anisakis simplex]